MKRPLRAAKPTRGQVNKRIWHIGLETDRKGRSGLQSQQLADARFFHLFIRPGFAPVTDGARINPAVAYCENNCGASITHLELGENVLDVVLDSLLADIQIKGSLSI